MMAGVDAEVVERIVAPLLDNARRYARARVTLGAAARDGAIVVAVADDGPGVDARRRATALFEPGVARRASTATAARGSGWRSRAGWPRRSGAT